MKKTLLRQHIRSIVYGAIGSRRIPDLTPNDELNELGVGEDRLLRRLISACGASNEASRFTVGQLVEALATCESKGLSMVQECATESRIRRLLACVLSVGRVNSGHEAQRWWYSLAQQIIWWCARETDEVGLRLIQQGVHVRATQALRGMGLLELNTLMEGSSDTKRSVLDVLSRHEFPDEAAERTERSLVAVAARVQGAQEGGGLQAVLRISGDRMAESLSDSLLTDFEPGSYLTDAVRSWLTLEAGIPTSVLSPSVMSFVKKFAGDGVTREMICRISDDLDLQLIIVDQHLAQFMDNMCSRCEPRGRGDRFCIDWLERGGMTVECPACPGVRDYEQTEKIK